MDEHEITGAINRARRGIKQYLEIMNMFPQTNVLHDHKFRKKYNAFYRVRQRPAEWYKVYFEYMENQKGRDVTFPEVLRYFKDSIGRYEPSFSSKLVATHNPGMPIWDVHVLSNIGLHAPSYNSPSKFDEAETAYRAIKDWYANYEHSPEGSLVIRKFDELISGKDLITNTKKIDFVLWQMRT